MAKELTERDLLNLKEKIEDAKSTVAQLKGHQQALLNQLKTEYGCKTIEEAEKKLKTMKLDIDELQDKIDKGTKALQDKYNLS